MLASWLWKVDGFGFGVEPNKSFFKKPHIKGLNVARVSVFSTSSAGWLVLHFIGVSITAFRHKRPCCGGWFCCDLLFSASLFRRCGAMNLSECTFYSSVVKNHTLYYAPLPCRPPFVRLIGGFRSLVKKAPSSSSIHLTEQSSTSIHPHEMVCAISFGRLTLPLMSD